MLRTTAALCTVLALFALPALAQTDIAGYYSASHVGSTTDNGTTIDFDRGRGYGVSINHFWGDHFSTEFAASSLRYDGSLDIGGGIALDTGRLKIRPITAVAQWHFARSGRVDPYIGGGAAHVTADDLSSSDLDAVGIGTVNVESKTTWVANAGLNIGLLDKLGLVIDGKYIDYTPESGPSDARVKLDLKPTVISVGLRWRF